MLLDSPEKRAEDERFIRALYGDGHTTTVRTGLPKVQWRSLHEAAAPGKTVALANEIISDMTWAPVEKPPLGLRRQLDTPLDKDWSI